MNLTSKKHLDIDRGSYNVEQFTPASKYTIRSFSEVEVRILRSVYEQSFPSLLFNGDTDIYFPSTYRRMSYVTIDGQRMNTSLPEVSLTFLHFVTHNFVLQK